MGPYGADKTLVPYSDVIMIATAYLITSVSIVQSFVQAQIKENIKAPRHGPSWGEFTGSRWIPAQSASNAEKVPIWWRHHGVPWWPMYADRCDSDFKCVIFVFSFGEWYLQYFLWILPSGDGSGNGLVSTGTMPLLQPMLTQIYVVIWRH